MNLFTMPWRVGAVGVLAGLLLAGCGGEDAVTAPVAQTQTVGSDGVKKALAIDPVPTYSDWPAITSAIPKNADTESRIAQIVAGMTLEQKVGQMTQPEIHSITPDEVRQYFIGSVLNGGGSWPNYNMHATAADWVSLADAFYDASMSTTMSVKIPIIWGTDAVHGHNNVYQATLFPHNIGLGAAHDPDLVRRIGGAVGQATRATGINWVFAPTIAVARDDRWGRTYESFSEDPAIVRAYAGSYVTGLQGTFGSDANVVATAKHFIGDGGTDQGINEGVNMSSNSDMINIHGQGYYSALGAGAQTVMASFNSWSNPSAGITIGKMHGSKTMLTDVLKAKMGFDGFVVSDWNGIGQVKTTNSTSPVDCTNSSCPQAINAGIDMVMVPDDWKAFIANTVAQVQSGQIPMSRIDDAVTRILRVKFRAGLFNYRKPSLTPGAGDASRLAARDLAREAVRKSLVMLKNNGSVLPVTRGRRVLVVGQSAQSIPNQAGGWSLTWQGDRTTNDDYAGIGDTILAGIQEATGAANVQYSADGSGVDVSGFDVVVAVIGESPYAETAGDRQVQTLAYWLNRSTDMSALRAVSGKGKPVVTVLLNGRPLYVNDALNLSDAFVVAWLPGTEGKGIADVLFRNAAGAVNFDFAGTLPFSWPADPCQTPLNAGDGKVPQFALNYGLKYASSAQVARLSEPNIPASCSGAGVLPIFNQIEYDPFKLYANAEANGWQPVPVGSDPNSLFALPATNPSIQIATAQVNSQQDAKLVTWLAPAQFFAIASQTQNLGTYTNGTLEFDTMVSQSPASTVMIHMDCGYPCRGSVDVTNKFRSFPLNLKQTVKIPLSCFSAAGANLASVTAPFSIQSSAGFKAAFTNFKVVKDGASASDVTPCNELNAFSLFGRSGAAPGFAPGAWSTNGSHVTFQSIPQGSDPAEVRVQYSWDTTANGLFFVNGGQADLSGLANGQLMLDLYLYSYGANASGLVVKMESPGPCRSTLDVPIGRPATGQWSTVTLPMSSLLSGAQSCFDLSRVNFITVLPTWGDQRGVQMTVRNVRVRP